MYNPKIRTTSDNEFICTWEQNSQVYMRRYNSNSDSISNEIQVSALPQHRVNLESGYFTRISSPQRSIFTFTQQEVTNGEIQFVHDGSQEAPSYEISVGDGTNFTHSFEFITSNQKILDTLNIDSNKIKDEYICKISYHIMDKPVKMERDTWCEKSIIEQWVVKTGLNPFNRQPLELNDLKVDKSHREKLEKFIQPLKKLYNNGYILPNFYFPKTPLWLFKLQQNIIEKEVIEIPKCSFFANKRSEVEKQDSKGAFEGLKRGFLCKPVLRLSADEMMILKKLAKAYEEYNSSDWEYNTDVGDVGFTVDKCIEYPNYLQSVIAMIGRGLYNDNNDAKTASLLFERLYKTGFNGGLFKKEIRKGFKTFTPEGSMKRLDEGAELSAYAQVSLGNLPKNK